MKQAAEELNKLLLNGSRDRLTVRYKNRSPNPGTCVVLMVDFESRRMSIGNGTCRYYPSFDEVEFVDVA